MMIKFFSKKWLLLIIAVIIVVGFPIITNSLMFITIPKFLDFLAPQGISSDSIWIGFFATFYGAVIGGGISGLFTFIGVKKTVSIQELKENEKQRAILELHDIFGGGYNLKNINDKNGRLIITDQYKFLIKNEKEFEDCYLNYLLINNSGPGKALNCSIELTITFEKTRETFITKAFIPVIPEKENIYILSDKIIDEKQNRLNLVEYRLTHIQIEYDTSANETIRIKRRLENLQEGYETTDIYCVKKSNEETFNPLFKLRGSDTSWYFLKDLNK